MLIGGAVFQLSFEAVTVLPILIEGVVREAVKARIHGAQRQPGSDATVLRRRAKQVLHVNIGFQFRRFHPTLLPVWRQLQLHLQLIRLKLFNIDGGMTKQR